MGGSAENEFLEHVAKRHGRAIYDVWPGVDYNIQLECQQGHRWSTLALNVLYHNHWCKECSDDSMRLGLKSAMAFAVSHDGECLSTSYRNVKTALLWRCREGHTWQGRLDNMKRTGRFCPVCRNAKRSPFASNLEELQEIAARHEGELVSTSFQTASHVYSWRCKHGHDFRSRPRLAAPHWCGKCRDFRQQMAWLREIARSYGGELLSPHYVDSRFEYHWRCAAGHEFRAGKYKARERFCLDCKRPSTATRTG